MKFSRNQQQELTLAIIYSALTYAKADVEFSLTELIEGICKENYEDVPIFIKDLTIQTLKHQQDIIDVIEPKLNKWKFHRLNRMTQAIFLMSYAHFYYIGGVEKNVVINIAVKHAKKFIVEDDYKFINAVLDEVLINE
ncbi:MAG: transcription antitermination factor NusB [Bacilli bacterium]|jgi:transcription antitermination factor NusB